jgi:hypothetical protein
VIGVEDDTLLGVIDTLAAAKGLGEEVVENVSKHIV